jgi:hypothetical protein
MKPVGVQIQIHEFLLALSRTFANDPPLSATVRQIADRYAELPESTRHEIVQSIHPFIKVYLPEETQPDIYIGEE